MKNPLHYQLSEYDCGPTSLLNGISYLFEREAIPPELLRNIMLYCLDGYGADGASGKSGTSGTAMMFLAHWLNGYGQAGHLPISARQLLGASVHLRQDGAVRDALCRGGAVVVQVDLEGWHYVLLTAVRGDDVLLFDPYYRETPFSDPALRVVTGHPTAYNRIVPAAYLDRTTRELYALGPEESREAVLLFNENTRLTPEKTVEYFI
ncbi:MAG: peptidase C39 [Gemmiger sp.]